MSNCQIPLPTYQRPECSVEREVGNDGESKWYRCGHCHKPVNPGNDFCHRCGWRLIDSDEGTLAAFNTCYEHTCQKVETVNRDGHEIGRCSNCRAWIRESNNYCSQCGCKVVD